MLHQKNRPGAATLGQQQPAVGHNSSKERPTRQGKRSKHSAAAAEGATGAGYPRRGRKGDRHWCSLRCWHGQPATARSRLPLLGLEDAWAFAQAHTSRGALVCLLVEAEAAAVEAHIVALGAGQLGGCSARHTNAALAFGVLGAGVGGASVAEGAAAGTEGAQQSLSGGCTAVALMSAGPPGPPARLPACHCCSCTHAVLVHFLWLALEQVFLSFLKMHAPLPPGALAQRVPTGQRYERQP